MGTSIMNFAKRVYKLQSTRSVCSQSRSFRSLIRPQRVFIHRRMFADAAQAVDTDNTNGDNANTNETKNEQSEEEIAKAKKMALDRRSRQFGFANYEEFQDDLNHMRQMEQAKAAKYSTGRMSAKARQLMWYLHTEDPEVHTVESLAGAFGLHRERCRALLVLEGIMHVDHAEGHYVGNPNVLDKAAAKAGFYVAHTRIDQPEDYAETQRFHHGKKALIDGEIDEVAFQRLMEQKPLHIIARERHLKNKFPKEPPAATPEYLKHVHVVSKGKRRTLKGRTKWIVAQTKKIHDVTEQIKIPIQIHEKDGTVRTASWEEREEIFNIDKRKPRGNEMTPLEQVRKYAGTPWHYRGTLYNNKKWKAYLEEVKEGKHRVEGDFYEYNDPDLVEAGDETNDSSFDLDTKTTKKSLRNESEEETIIEDNDILPGIEAEEDEEELENDDENTK